jgi:PAS domain-containing protein
MTLLRTAHGAWNAEEVGELVDGFAKHITQYGIVLLDPLGRITGWSEGSYRITGFSAEEVLGRGFSILFAD